MRATLIQIAAALAFGLLCLVSGCGSTAPQMKILGVSKPKVSRQLSVFIEVVNVSQRALMLSRLEYTLSTEKWFEADGALGLSKLVDAGESVIIEVPVTPVMAKAVEASGAVPYTLSARLVALADRVQRSWSIRVQGVLKEHAVAGARGASPWQMRVANRP